MEYHPASNLFPLMENVRFEELKHDIELHGQNDPIILFMGMILDGRNRYRALTELGMKVKTRDYDGEQSPIDYVISQNLHRRHLTSSQLACIATEAESLKARLQAEARERQREGAVIREEKKKTDLAELIPEGEKRNPESRDILAQQFKTNPRYIQDAERIKKERPDLFNKVKEGTIAMPKALTLTKGKEEEKKEPREISPTVRVNTGFGKRRVNEFGHPRGHVKLAEEIIKTYGEQFATEVAETIKRFIKTKNKEAQNV